MNDIQAAVALKICHALRGWIDTPLGAQGAFDLPDYLDWFPSDVGNGLRWCAAHPTDGDVFDPAPNPIALFILTALESACHRNITH